MRQPFAPAHFPAGASPAGVPSAASLRSMVAESFEGARRKSQAPAARAARTRSTVRPEGPIEGAGRPASKRDGGAAVSYTHLRAHETRHDLVCRLLLETKK